MPSQNPPCSPHGTDRYGEAVASLGGGPSRREFLKTAGVGATGMAMGHAATASAEAPMPSEANPVSVSLTLNGQPAELAFDARATLLDVLRERLSLTGTKKGCDHGACGSCTVHVNGRRVLSCLTLAATLDGAEVTTIEGLAGEELHDMQTAFLRCDAYQCGYCTPGQIMSAVKCIEEGHANQSPEEAREWMSGNLCRCGAYPNILEAVRQEAGVAPKGDPSERVTVLTSAGARESADV